MNSTKPATASAVIRADESPALALYDAACRAIAEARSVDEAKDISFE